MYVMVRNRLCLFGLHDQKFTQSGTALRKKVPAVGLPKRLIAPAVDKNQRECITIKLAATSSEVLLPLKNGLFLERIYKEIMSYKC